MGLVDSVLAFSLIMAALASVVTLIMESFHRVLLLRAKGMEALFHQFYDGVLVSKLQLTTAEKDRICQAVLINPTRDIIINASSRIFPNRVIENLMRHTEVSTSDLLNRLYHADAFTKLKEESEDQIRKTLSSIEDQYDAYSVAMSDYFKRRARLFSLLVGIALAFAANIDGLRIFDALMNSPLIRASIIGQQDNLERQFAVIQTEQQQMSDPYQAVNQAHQLEVIHADMEKVSRQMAAISSQGLPIGWDYFPGPSIKAMVTCDASVAAKAVEKTASGINKESDNPVIWMLKVLLTGLLIGLGAPFWFDVAQKLARIKQAVKGKTTSELASDSQSQPAVNKTIDKIVAAK
ncbi:MAG: hypothetical protein CO186_11585 [Zetaproteobacteria bacterium CG_4_9_14_3_um_filter_49_83]|nr:MAG: hypothetical protein AUJ56_12215 [Zetaproteobacteria bacterium CG1_02_49_23]PIQ31781.1 MAG: hypothetical protein COW62_08970 [Zetaproteobacteria bacterium CG17_big_fil_post_rev_8_21_14_2_50_50_13]PIV31418.1 MAG: hypothetical protein COS35_01580 [Zetaproteobacteria bacterium CG02_land_8_20_14_3_00_50_9]PIY56652.1 MAG: hypothetical protein COZ00_03215 [Zetaproteobacteria bacterium CG_4_10_14_0_8_um_filter_49_80]PJA34206.1 MAG: hypothetical protein CO186_11585 [Zetaproteobacteria bacterium